MKYERRRFLLPAILAVAGLLFMACPTGDDSSGGEGVITYTVTFDLGYTGGTAPAPIKVEKGQAALRDFPADPVRTDYEFSGWYDGETKYTQYTTISKDVILTAQWGALYTVTFDIGYSEGTSPEHVILKPGQSRGILFPPNPERPDYIFRGWFAETDKYDLTTPITASVTLTAQWFQGYQVNFEVVGGMAAAVEPVIVEQGQAMGGLFPAAPQLPEKFTFNGWYDDQNTLYNSQTVINSNITLTSKWTKDSDVDRISARNGAFPVFKFTVPVGGRFGDYTKITVKFLLNDENQSTATPILRLYGNYAATVFTQSGTAYLGTNNAADYLVFNDNMWARNTWKEEPLNKASLPQKEWFTVEIPFDIDRYNTTAKFPGEDASGDFYFGLGLGLGGGTASATHFTSYMTEVTLSNDDGSKKAVSPGGGFDKPVMIGTGLVDITRE